MTRPRVLILADDEASAREAQRQLSRLGFDAVARSGSVDQALDEDRFFDPSIDMLCVLDFSGFSGG